MQAPLQARNDSDAVEMRTTGTATQEGILARNLPAEVARREQAGSVNDSPRVLQQRAQSDAIHDSPRMVAQRHARDALFGGTVGTERTGATTAKVAPPKPGRSNTTGLPDRLKAGIEALSGMSMDHVKVHYNSDKPAQLQAHAYAQGGEIHLGAGQERHLPHEAWHVVQQAQGRVRATFQMKAAAVNDDPSLEKEADVMGEKAVGGAAAPATEAMAESRPAPAAGLPATQGVPVFQLVARKKKKLADKLGPKDGGIKERDSARDGPRALLRLRAARRRNLKSKGRPVVPRFIHGRQARFHSGYRDADIAKLVGSPSTELTVYNPNLNPSIDPRHSQLDVGDVRGYFRRGFGGQPFLYLQSDNYDDKMIPSNYDDIIAHFAGQDQEVAFDILSNIQAGSDLGTDRLGQAQGFMVLLTQFIESHSSRIPGADKFARALLRRIALGQLTFAEAFNRENGLFVSAWATKGGAPVGGQMAGRALFGASRSTDRFDFDDLSTYLGEEGMNQIFETVDDYFSDDSDTEDDAEDGASMAEEWLEEDADLGRINAALGTLGFTERLTDLRELPMLGALAARIQKQYLKQVITKHPDKGGNQDEFNELAVARTYLAGLIGDHGSTVRINLDDENLRRNLQSEGRVKVPVAGDGNCFYSAVLHQVIESGGAAVAPADLRTRLANLVAANQNALRLFVTGERLQRLLADILTSRSWNNIGGDFAPQLMATVLQRQIRIVQPGGVLSFNPNPDLVIGPDSTLGGGGGPLTIAYDGRGHYDSTRDVRGRLPAPSSQ